MSKWCFCVSLVKLRHLVQEIDCRQGSYSMVTLKIWSPKSNQIFKPSQHYNKWSLARIRDLVQEISCRQAFFFGQSLIIQGAGVTLKMRSRSPKSNQFFPPSKWCTCARLVKIHPLVQKTECRQEATRTPMGSAPKAVCPMGWLPFGCGDILIWGLYPNHMHVFRPWQKNTCKFQKYWHKTGGGAAHTWYPCLENWTCAKSY